MKITKTKVSRTMEIPGQGDVERSTTVAFKEAETPEEMIQLCGNDRAKALGYFNAGRWADLRTSVSNKLAGKSSEQRNFDKMVSAFQSLNPALSTEQVNQIVLSMPNMADALKNQSGSDIPAETDEEFFAAKKDEKKDAPTGEAAA